MQVEVKMQVIDLYLYLNVTLPQVFFKHFASKNQLPGLFVRGTLVKNGLTLEEKVEALIAWLKLECL